MTTAYVPREKLLVGGPAGSGKTYSFMKIVEALKDGHHIAIEVDDGFSKIAPKEFPHIATSIYQWTSKSTEADPAGGEWVTMLKIGDGETLKVYHCNNFVEVRRAQDQVGLAIASGKISAGDWVCADGADLMYNNMRYQMVQRTVAAKTDRRSNMPTQTDAWEAAIEMKVEGAPILDRGDWDTIHSFYESFMNYCVFQIPCNVYWAVGLTTFDDKAKFQQDEVKKFYQDMGVPFKFEGQKRVPRAFDTLLVLLHDTSGYYVNLWKDRGGQGRPWSTSGKHSVLANYTNTNFYLDVGVKLLGWPAIKEAPTRTV